MEPIPETFHYDVFLSFRGEDTRNNFTSHLYGALKRNNLHVFHDSSLRPGLVIGPWCMDELAQMMDCLDNNPNHIIRPVFLDVNKSDVVTQQGSYNEAFRHHQEKFSQSRVQNWREALRKAGEKHGLHLQSDAKGDHEALKDQIVEKVKNLLYTLDLNEFEKPLVGIESRIQDVMSLLNPISNDDGDDVRGVVICGPAGNGKTTIAYAIYKRLAIHFKAHYCFLADVKTVFRGLNGKVALQKMLLSSLLKDGDIRIDNYHQGIGRIERMIKHQKILLVIDDVDDEEHVKVLSMNRGLLGRGSRIIVTTRDKSVVGMLKPDAIHEVRLLDESESMKVFCLDAFGQDRPKEGYEEVSREAVCLGAGRVGVLKDLAVHLGRF